MLVSAGICPVLDCPSRRGRAGKMGKPSGVLPADELNRGKLPIGFNRTYLAARHASQRWRHAASRIAPGLRHRRRGALDTGTPARRYVTPQQRSNSSPIQLRTAVREKPTPSPSRTPIPSPTPARSSRRHSRRAQSPDRSSGRPALRLQPRPPPARQPPLPSAAGWASGWWALPPRWWVQAPRWPLPRRRRIMGCTRRSTRGTTRGCSVPTTTAPSAAGTRSTSRSGPGHPGPGPAHVAGISVGACLAAAAAAVTVALSPGDCKAQGRVHIWVGGGAC